MNCGGRLRALTKKCISAAEADRLNKDEGMGRQVEAKVASPDAKYSPISAVGEECLHRHSFTTHRLNKFKNKLFDL